jgi:predicted phage gp36 major capsid-like protein
MFPDQIRDVGPSAIEVRDHLTQLQAERALAQSTKLSEVGSYMADLDEEIEITRRLYTVSAVTEIATLRAELFGAQQG